MGDVVRVSIVDSKYGRAGRSTAISTVNQAVISKRYAVVGMCFAAVFVCHIDRVNISVAAIAMQSEFGWSASPTRSAPSRESWQWR